MRQTGACYRINDDEYDTYPIHAFIDSLGDEQREALETLLRRIWIWALYSFLWGLILGSIGGVRWMPTLSCRVSDPVISAQLDSLEDEMDMAFTKGESPVFLKEQWRRTEA